MLLIVHVCQLLFTLCLCVPVCMCLDVCLCVSVYQRLARIKDTE